MKRYDYSRVALLILAVLFSSSVHADIVINEIFYHPESECEPEEFVEIYNNGNETVDLTGWAFTEGVRFRFPDGAQIAPGAYLVVCRELEGFRSQFGALSGLLGSYSRKLNNDGEDIVLADGDGEIVDRVDYDDVFPWPVKADGLGGSLELVNSLADNEGPEYWRPSGGPTPGRRNSQYRDGTQLPPFVKAVSHLPETPASSEEVTVSAQIVDSNEIPEINLHYQVVPPGGYIRITDTEYQTEWTEVPMRDDGVLPDRRAGDGFYVAVLPPQPHRTLIRYKVRTVNSKNEVTWSPYPSDSCPNYAYFVYDGVPPYRVSNPSVPGVTVHTELEKVPVYHLIAAEEDTDECQYVPIRDNVGRRLFKWRGTFVGGGKVYDHIRFRLRGGVWRYTFNKRMWKVRLNQGHLFQGVDNDGQPFGEPRKTINLNAVTQNMNLPNPHRGECGLFEWCGFLLFKMAGVGSPETTFVHFRVIDNEDESGEDQYSGDFYGIFLDIEQPDQRLLETNGYSPDCNLYKMNRGWTVDGKIWEKETNNCNPADDADIREFYNGYHRSGTDYLRRHLDIPNYLSYRSILEAIHHYDVYAEKNYYYLNNVETGLWEVWPWDLDITFGSDHGNGKEPFRDLIVGDVVFERREGPYATEYRNRLREICQLLYNEEVLFPKLDQARDLIVELAAADRDRWDNFKPLDAPPHKAHYKSLDERLEEMKAWIRKRIQTDYTDGNGNRVYSLEKMYEDPDIPNQPRVVQPDSEVPVPQGELIFSSSPFSDPNSDSELAAIRWIVKEEGGNELEPDWSYERAGDEAMTVEIPASLLQSGILYRCRVRHKDQTGRWSFWSEPQSFILQTDTGVENWTRH